MKRLSALICEETGASSLPLETYAAWQWPCSTQAKNSYGSSIPHIDPTDFAELEIVRLKNTDENAIAELAEASAKARAEADVIERSIAHLASAIIERFMSGQIT